MATLPRSGRCGDDFHRAHGNIRVFLDGVEQKYVVAYDKDAGTIEKHVINKDGSYRLRNGEIMTEILHGEVDASL